MAMMAHFDDPTLTAEDEASLTEDRIIVQKSSGGKRKVSAAFLTPPGSHAGSVSSNSSSSSTSSVTASVRFRALHTADYTFTLPEHSESVAAVEFCGFTSETAFQIYSRFASRSSDNPDGLLEFMVAQTTLSKGDMPPREAMTKAGVSQWLQDAVLDERFEDLRQTETTTTWIVDSIQVNHATLLQLQQRLKALAIYTHKSKKKRSSLQQAGLKPSEPEWNPPGSATATSNVPGLSQFHNLPEAHVTAVDTPPEQRADHYTLFKGKAAVEMGDWISEDGTLQLQGLRTYANGDFNLVPAYYWTLERWTAKKYCDYAQIRCPYSEIWLLQFQVKKTFVDSLRTHDLWYGHEWKEFVWNCRKGNIPPTRYDDLWKSAELIKGHVCKSTSQIISKIKAENVQTAMTERNIMVRSDTDGTKATQWCFVGLEVMTRFDHEAKGKFHVEILAPEGSETSKVD